jgi:SWI/SNF-related matrix-associated actin-dependent regulator 1 of chromatin subfamily A
LKNLRKKPYKFQEEGIQYAIDHHYCIIGDQMGLGKTLQAIIVREITDLPTVVVCPGYLRDTWKKEIEETFNLSPQVFVCYDKHDCEYLNKVLWHEQARDVQLNIVILSYELIQHAHYVFAWAKMYIADEVHYLKNTLAKRTKHFHAYLQGFMPERFIGLSGTSIKNKAVEWYSPLMLCSYNPKKTSGVNVQQTYRSLLSFGEMFGKRRVKNFGGRQIVDYIGIKNVPQLLELLKDKYIRRKVEDVIELPAIVEKDVICTNKMDDELLKRVWGGGFGGDYVMKVKCDSAYAKADFTADHIDSILENDMGPVICFSDHVRPVDYIAQALKDKGYRVAIIKGEVEVGKRAGIVEKFQAGAYDVLVATIGSASTGYTLTRANQMVFNDIPWGPADLWQAQKRFHRIGQKSTCFIHYILGSKIDTLILKTIKAKKEVLEQAL